MDEGKRSRAEALASWRAFWYRFQQRGWRTMNETLGTFSEPTLAYVAGLARGVPPGAAIVEIGAYYGRVTATLSACAPPGSHVFSLQARAPFFEHAGKTMYGSGTAASVERYDFNLLAENTRALENVTVLLERSPPSLRWPKEWAPGLVLVDISSRPEIIAENAIYWVPLLVEGGCFVVVSRKFLLRENGIDTVMKALHEAMPGAAPRRWRIEADRYFLIE
jgi:hypothetical protein